MNIKNNQIDGFCLCLAIVAKTKPPNDCNVYILIQFSKHFQLKHFLLSNGEIWRICINFGWHAICFTRMCQVNFVIWCSTFCDLEEKTSDEIDFPLLCRWYCHLWLCHHKNFLNFQFQTIQTQQITWLYFPQMRTVFFFKWKHHYFALARHINIANILWTDLLSIVVTVFLLAFGLLFSCAEIDVELEIGKIEF